MNTAWARLRAFLWSGGGHAVLLLVLVAAWKQGPTTMPHRGRASASLVDATIQDGGPLPSERGSPSARVSARSVPPQASDSSRPAAATPAVKESRDGGRPEPRVRGDQGRKPWAASGSADEGHVEELQPPWIDGSGNSLSLFTPPPRIFPFLFDTPGYTGPGGMPVWACRAYASGSSVNGTYVFDAVECGPNRDQQWVDWDFGGP